MTRQGKKWTIEEDKKLKALFNDSKSFFEMGKELDRTWFACKCRLARLGLIDDLKVGGPINWAEKFRVPKPANFKHFKELEQLMDNCFSFIEEEETYNTFDDEDLDIISAYLKARYSKVVIKLTEDHCFVKEIELKQSKEILEHEIRVVNSLKKMAIEEREKVIKKLC